MQDTLIKKNVEEINNVIEGEKAPTDYDFLHGEKGGVEIKEDKFDLAFNKSSPVIQEYILSDKFEENIKLICKMEKLDSEKAITVIENITISILIGLLSINDAKETLIESFKSSGILIESFSAGLILKNIDAYILKDIRKQILESKIEEKKEIRHLTLKETKEEKEKEELRKILLERTGNLTGKNEPVFQYQKREPKKEEKENSKWEEKKEELNRDSLLAKIHLQNVSDTEKIKERMLQIKQEEEERLKKEKKKEEEDSKIREQREIKAAEETEEKENTKKEVIVEKKEDQDISKTLANILKEKITSHEGDNVDLDVLRKERAEKEEVITKQKNMYLESMKGEKPAQEKNIETSFDPYRETF